MPSCIIAFLPKILILKTFTEKFNRREFHKKMCFGRRCTKSLPEYSGSLPLAVEVTLRSVSAWLRDGEAEPELSAPPLRPRQFWGIIELRGKNKDFDVKNEWCVGYCLKCKSFCFRNGYGLSYVNTLCKLTKLMPSKPFFDPKYVFYYRRQEDNKTLVLGLTWEVATISNYVNQQQQTYRGSAHMHCFYLATDLIKDQKLW